MKTMIAKLVPVFTCILCSLTSSLYAAGYSKAEITRLYNDVKVLKENAEPKTAAVGQEISSVTSVATGAGSRAELKFPDQSLTRLGANSRFTLRGDARTLDLEQGTMLLQVPEKILGAKVRTAAVTAAVTGGTALIEYLPGGYVKLIVIEGFVDLFMNNDPSNFKQFHAGEMLIMKADGNTIPDAVDVDLKVLLKTSKLITGNDQSGINQDLVNQAVQAQQGKIQSGELQPTNLAIPGQGTYVVLNTDNSQVTNVFKNIQIQNGNPTPTGPQGPQGPQNPGNQNPNNPTTPTDPGFQGFAPLISGRTILNNNATIRTNPHVTAPNVDSNGVLGTITLAEGIKYRGLSDGFLERDGDGLFQYFAFGNTDIISPDLQPIVDDVKRGNRGYWAIFKFENLNINGTLNWDVPIIYGPYSTVATNVALTAQNDIHVGANNQFPNDNIPAGAGGETTDSTGLTVLDLDSCASDHIDTLMLSSNKGSVVLKNPSGYAIKGNDQDLFLTAGLDVDIQGSILLESTATVLDARDGAELVAVAKRDVKVTNTNVEADSISLTAANVARLDRATVTANQGDLTIKGTKGVNITNSSQLRALMDNAAMLIQAETGNITVTDSMLEATEGTIELTANTGNINLQNVSVTASDVFKAQALGTNGWITIGNSTINATSLIDLYAAGANGGVKFIGDSELNSPSVSIRGKTVEIASGVYVHIPQRTITIDATNKKYQGAGGTDLTKGTFSLGTSLHSSPD